jgi:ABC-2 type transport system ATP-binding protein
VIDVEHISKHFGPHRAVSDVSFHVERGEILGFLGPNGAGKTTTMRILSGLYPPSAGTAKVAGLDVFEHSLEVRKKIGYLPENVPLYGEMTVNGFLGFAAETKGVDRSRRTTEVGRAVETCGLESVAHRYIKKLSKGYRQRVGLAQALVGDPDVLILDEPTIGLDPRQINEIRSVIKGFAGRKTVILSTHILPEVSMTCGRVVIINQGRVVAEDTPANLQAGQAGVETIRVQAAAGAEELAALCLAVDGVSKAFPAGDDGAVVVEATRDVRPQLARSVIDAGLDLLEIARLTATLEDVFLNLITQESGDGHDQRLAGL